MHFKDWAKIYNLKNLCTTLDNSMGRLAKKKIKKPQNLDKMIEYAKILSKPFKFVRVDFYDNFGKVLFGC